MKTKIVITGSNGLLGQCLVNLFSNFKNFEVFAFSKGKNRITNTKNFKYTNLDITDSKKVKSYLSKIKPNYIINCAAMTNVDACEIQQEQCIALNVDAVGSLIAYSEKKDCFLIHLSTDFIFDGKKGNYKEDDKPNPINFYGKSKLKSEKLIEKSKINSAIIRTILVYGIVEDKGRSNIVFWVKNALKNNEEIKVVTDQFRMPTYVKDLAEVCLLIINKDLVKSKTQITKDIYHVSSNKLLSVYEIALQIATVFNLDTSLIKKTTSNIINQAAVRPVKTGFNVKKVERELGLKMLSFKESLKIFKLDLEL